jgi:hypothetical protein
MPLRPRGSLALCRLVAKNAYWELHLYRRVRAVGHVCGELIMSNLQGNGATSEYKNHRVPAARFSGYWIAVALAAIILVLGLGYVYENGWLV